MTNERRETVVELSAADTTVEGVDLEEALSDGERLDAVLAVPTHQRNATERRDRDILMVRQAMRATALVCEVARLRDDLATICAAVGLPADDPAANVVEQVRRRKAARDAARAEAEELRRALADERDLVDRVFRTIHMGRRPRPLWAHVKDVFMHGSTLSRELCRDMGYDPDQEVGGSKRAAMIAADKATR